MEASLLLVLFFILFFVENIYPLVFSFPCSKKSVHAFHQHPPHALASEVWHILLLSISFYELEETTFGIYRLLNDDIW